MYRSAATDVSPSEWRWVIIFSGLLIAFTLLPYAWAFASDAPNDGWQFMGMLHNHIDGATYLSKIGQGARGAWLFSLTYTPEAHDSAAINEFYLLLGHLSSALGLSPLLMYHIARVMTGFMMYAAIYHLGSTIWSRLRPRRLFFAIAAVGSGLGWLVVVLAPRITDLPTDLLVPESIPFYATLVNPHFPFAIALITLLASTFVMISRPGFTARPSLGNGGAAVVLVTVALSIVQPQGWPPIAAAMCLYLAVLAVIRRRIPGLELRWVLLAVLPALPFLAYYLAVVGNNPAIATWNTQNYTPSPSPDKYILGFGLPLLIAVPGLWRAFRRFEQDGDRFMLLWFVTNSALLYAPFNLQRRLAIGLIIPIVYFAVRALEDFWFHLIGPRWRDAALVAVFVFMVPSNILSLIIPIFGVVRPQEGIQQALLLPQDEFKAIRWLDANARPDQIVLAPPGPSLWIPSYSALRVVYGHPFETLNAAQKRQEVMDWYAGQQCKELVEKYRVSYIVTESDSQGQDTPTQAETCLRQLNLSQPVTTFGGVSIYHVTP